ncbi:MAG: TonB-dependent receptor plug domain-containing protein [Terriglobales bacterium]
MPKRILFLLVLAAMSLFAQESSQQADANKDQQKLPVHRETVVVTGTFQPLPLEEADRAVNSLDTREAPLLFGTFVDYLRSEPSLDLRERGSNDVQVDVSMRGASFGQTLVLVNGFRFNDAQSGHHNFDMPFPLLSMERIEVLRGAGSTYYGADALGGAVNFITAPPAATEFRLGSAVGNFGINQQHASVSYSSKRISQQVSVARDFSSGFMADRDYRNLQFGSNTHVKNALGYANLLMAYSDKPFGANQFYGPYNSWERTKAWFAGITQDLGTKTQAAFAYRRHTDDFLLFRDKPLTYENRHSDESWEAALRRHDSLSQKAVLSYGAEAYRDTIDSIHLKDGVITPALGSHARNRGAIYLDLDMRALRRFSFSIGAREEVYAGTQTHFSPTVSGAYWVSSKLKLRTSVSNGFRLPTYTDLYYADPGNIGNPNLKPESAWNYEGGLDWNANDKLGGSVTVFHRRERNDIDFSKPVDPADPYVDAWCTAHATAGMWCASNVQNLRFTGVEASLRLRLARDQRVDFAYTGLTADREPLPNMLSKYAFQYLSHSGTAAWQGRLPGRLLGRTRVGVLQRRERDAYPLWNLSLMRTFSYFTPYLQLTNLSNTGYADLFNPDVRVPGRTAVLGMEFALSRKSK